MQQAHDRAAQMSGGAGDDIQRFLFHTNTHPFRAERFLTNRVLIFFPVCIILAYRRKRNRQNRRVYCVSRHNRHKLLKEATRCEKRYKRPPHAGDAAAHPPRVHRASAPETDPEHHRKRAVRGGGHQPRHLLRALHRHLRAARRHRGGNAQRIPRAAHAAGRGRRRRAHAAADCGGDLPLPEGERRPLRRHARRIRRQAASRSGSSELGREYCLEIYARLFRGVPKRRSNTFTRLPARAASPCCRNGFRAACARAPRNWPRRRTA